MIEIMDTENIDAQQSSHRELMAALESRKNSLELKLQDCTQELKQLCIKEAELTGVLPPEIPLEPGESPPQFRKRVGTAFQYPENLINGCKTSKSKEEETIDTLELALKIQAGIVEVALGLANDPNASKAVRRKRRQDYQLAYERLQELKAQLSNCRQAHKTLKQRKKPRPPLDCDMVPNPLQVQKGENENDTRSSNSWNQNHADTIDGLCMLRHPTAQNTFTRHPSEAKSAYTIHHSRHGYYQTHFLPGQYSGHHYPTLASCAHPELERMGYWAHHDHAPPVVNRVQDVSEKEKLWYTDQEKLWYATAPHPVRGTSSECVDTQHDREWFGSLDRRRVVTSTQSDSDYSSEPRCIERGNGYYPIPSYSFSSNKMPFSQTLLPNQMYPESGSIDSHGLVRAHSLDSVGQQNTGDHSSSNRKPKEKEWYETSLDSSPRRTKLIAQRNCSPSVNRTVGPIVKVSSDEVDTSRDVSSHNRHELNLVRCDSDTSHNSDAPVAANIRCLMPSPISASLDSTGSEDGDTAPTTTPAPPKLHTPTAMSTISSFDTIVPFESPKNHTVVQAGMWQPYREVTKPFEMSDFYKYSTKFRKATAAAATAAAATTCQQPPASPQQKGIYQPLQPMTCQPLDPNATEEARIQNISPNSTIKESVSPESVGDTFSTEMLAWYQDQNVPRSATLV